MNARTSSLANVRSANVGTPGEVTNAAVVATHCTYMSTTHVLVSIGNLLLVNLQKYNIYLARNFVPIYMYIYIFDIFLYYMV